MKLGMGGGGLLGVDLLAISLARVITLWAEPVFFVLE